MLVFNTFSNRKRQKDIPETDILIWTASLAMYKGFGYKTKLYCLESDLPFLEQWHLLSLYDEVDTESLSDTPMIAKTNDSKFWSSRKIEAMHRQLFDLGEDAIYSDTDVLMRAPFDLSHDCLVWSPEDGSIYVPWRNLSKPEGYRMPQHVVGTRDAYNCGILWFRDRDVFAEWRDEYYAFAVGNPCKIKHRDRDDVDDLLTNESVWACNAEQRILKAVLDHRGVDVGTVMPEKKNGWSRQGVHYFYYRISWRFIGSKEYDPAPDAIPMLNLTAKECLSILRALLPNHWQFWASRPWLEHVGETDPRSKHWPIRSYF